MAAIRAVHECLFCLQVFDSAAAKDDHVLEHFAQETCTDCNQNLVRIGSHLYTRHTSVTCIKGGLKSEENNESGHMESVVSRPPNDFADETPVKEEPFDDSDTFPFDTNLCVHTDENTIQSVDVQQVKAEPTEQPDEQDYISIDDGESQNKMHQTNRPIESGTNTGEFKCEICNLLFKSKASHHTHMWRKHDVRKRKGKLCGNVSPTELSLSDLRPDETPEADSLSYNTALQMKTVPTEQHAEQDIFISDIDYTSQIKRPKTNRRIKSGIYTGEFTCEACNIVFKSKESRHTHMWRKHKVNAGKRKGKFLTESSLNDHNNAKKIGETSKADSPAYNTAQNVDVLQVKLEPVEELHGQAISIDGVESSTQIKRLTTNRPIESGTNTSEFKCELCDVVFKSKESRRRHMWQKHDSNVQKFKCKTCYIIFSKESSLQDHRCKRALGRKNEDPIPCEICGRLLSDRASLRKHNITLHNKREENDKRYPIPCEICGKVILSKKAHEKHLILMHSPPGTIFCSACAQIFSNDDDLDAHKSECVMKTGYPCKVCGKVLANKNSFRIHNILLHSPPDVIFCNACARKFTTTEARDTHRSECVLKHRMQKLKRPTDLCCDICGKMGFDKRYLTKHKILAHSPEGTIFCSKCARIFSDVVDRDAHEPACILKLKAQRHQSYKRRRCSVVCEVCGTVYRDRHTLRKHKIWVHSAPGTIFCKYCARKFPNVVERDMHSVECGLKKKMLNSKPTLRRFECDICKEIFNAKYKLRDHMQKSHNILEDKSTAENQIT